MFKSIFSKHVTTFMLIIVVSFVALATIISSMLANFYTENSEEELEVTAASIKYILEERLDDSSYQTLNDFIARHNEEIEAYFSALTRHKRDTAVFVTDESGNVLAAIGFTDSTLTTKALSETILHAIHNGGYNEKDSDLDGLLLSERSVRGVAVINEDRVIGSVFACSTHASIRQLTNSTIKTIILTCLWVLLAALIAVYFLTDKIIGPLKDMGHAAKAFAAGRFDVRVPVIGNDEISELAVAFNNMASSLADLESMRSSFLSNVSHDLRTPMTTISGFIDGLLDGTIPEEKRDYYLRVIGDEVRRLSRLVAALLEVSRIQAGDRKFVTSTFDICEMTRVILISFEQKIEKKHLDVEFDTDAESLYVSADHDAIYQILYNICDNAVKFSREGGKYRIRIVERGRKIFVSVYNEGIGIASEDLPHVFDRFYKSDKSRGLDKTGVGLGLYIAKTILDAHGEEIWVKSKHEEYCEFVFTLKKATDGQVKKTFDKLPEGE